MRGPLVHTSRLVRHARASAAAVALAASALGCGPGLAVRGRGPEAIGRTGGGVGASAGAGSTEGPRPGGPSNEAPDHEDELPPLPAAAVMDEPSDVAPEPASLRGGAPLATRYASLDRAQCEAELGKRHVAFERVGEARGVIAPLRLRGTIAGIDFHSMLPASQRRTSPYEIYDCRLVLALDDWARVLARYDVVEVVHYSVYRPPPAKQVLNGAGRRHSGALAIDAAIFKTRDGQTISVEKDFHGRIGQKPCGANAASTAALPAQAVTLRKIVCEAADAQLFNVMLTPDYNWPHRNHFHLEVTAGARWILVR
jgi:hypothetical protein